MSTSIYKVPYKCDCGIDYGSCGAECAVILVSHNSSDTYHLLHTDSHRRTDGSREPVTGLAPTCFGDAYLSALRTAINMVDTNANTLTDDESEACQNPWDL